MEQWSYVYHEPDFDSKITEREWALAADFARKEIEEGLFQENIQAWQEILNDLLEKKLVRFTKKDVKTWANSEHGLRWISSFPNAPK